MAKAAKKTKPPARKVGELQVQVVVETGQDSAYYANYAEVTAAQHEYLLSFARTPAKLSADQMVEARGGTLRVEAGVQVLLPPSLVPGLIKALQDTLEKAGERNQPHQKDRNA